MLNTFKNHEPTKHISLKTAKCKKEIESGSIERPNLKRSPFREKD